MLAAATRERLADLAYDFDGLAEFMHELDLTTLQLVWRASADAFVVRNPFPVGGVVEDPATGAAALAFGAYLRELAAVPPAARLTLRQGDDLGRPSLLEVELRAGDDRVRVTGAAVRMPPTHDPSHHRVDHGHLARRRPPLVHDQREGVVVGVVGVVGVLSCCSAAALMVARRRSHCAATSCNQAAERSSSSARTA